MQKPENPFAPGAGITPPELAGHDDVLRAIRVSYLRSKNGIPPRSFMLLGLRGVGKTVLLNEIARVANEDGCIVSSIETPEPLDLASLLYPIMKDALLRLSSAELTRDLVARGFRALRNFAKSFRIKAGDAEIAADPEPGVADSGNLEFDLPDMFELIGKAAKKQGRVWVLLIDEIQHLDKRGLSAIIAALHRMSQRGLPVIMVGAGLPQVARLACEAKSYSERLFDWRQIGPLTASAIQQAVRKPIEQRGVAITQEALDRIAALSEGYPLFIQALAYCAWEEAKPSTITLDDVRKAYAPAVDSMMPSVSSGRHNRLTAAELQFVTAMASLKAPPYRTGDVAKALGRSPGSCSRLRKNLIKKEIIYSPRYGLLDFAVPLFAKYLNGTLQHADGI